MESNQKKKIARRKSLFSNEVEESKEGSFFSIIKSTTSDIPTRTTEKTGDFRQLLWTHAFIALILTDIILNAIIAVLTTIINKSSYSSDLYLLISIRLIGCMHSIFTDSTGTSLDLITISLLYLVVKAFSQIFYVPVANSHTALFWIYIVFNLFITLAESMSLQTKSQSSHDNQMPLTIKPVDKTTQQKSKKKRVLAGLEGLRFLASIHIVLYHFNSDEGSYSWRLFLSWAGSQLTYFFVLSGFILAYQYSERCATICNTEFWMRRFARLYPSLQLSIVCMCLLIPSNLITPKVLVEVIFSVTAWDSTVFENVINTPAW
jgi:hypothetical protein